MFAIVFQVVLSILLILAVLLQQGSGISPAFGGSGESFRSRRSAEKLLFYSTILLAVLFAVTSIVLLIPR